MPLAPSISQAKTDWEHVGDDRALQWRHLLPTVTGFRIAGVLPTAARDVIREQADPAGDTLVVYRQLPVPSPSSRFDAVVVLNPVASAASLLHRVGFDHQLMFTAIPSFANPRILAPIGNRQV